MSTAAEMSAVIAKYLRSVTCLVVEPSAPFMNNIVSCLVALGADKTKITATIRYEDAVAAIPRTKPQLIVTEYQVGEHFGLELVDMVDKLVGETNRIAILATRNANDTSVAEAAEEQVDAYILKPFSMGDFQRKIEACILAKARPSPYSMLIRKGKEFLNAGNFNSALLEFSEAKEIGKKPSLAHYYCGVVQDNLKQPEKAIEEFEAGLKITPLHYPCLTGEFDVLFKTRQFQKAFKLVDAIKAHFPISPQRLGNMTVAAVYSNRVEELVDLFRIYTSFSNRPPELVKIMTESLKLGGRLMVKANRFEDALTYFELGAVSSQLNAEFIESAIRELLAAQAISEAQELFKKVPRHAQHTGSYQILNFMLNLKGASENDNFEAGRKLLATLDKGEVNFYREMVKLAAKLNKKMIGEDIIQRAVTEFPDLRKELFEILG